MNTIAKRERWLILVLRSVGSVSLLAAIAVFLPYDWMNHIHQAMELGTLPDEPIVGYLARTLSAFYALMGGLLWVLSCDPPRYQPALRYLGAGFLLFGAIAFGVDCLEGMPRFWTIGEGPIVIAFGAMILAFNRHAASVAEPRG